MRNSVLALACLALAAPAGLAQTTTGPWAQKFFYGVTSHDFSTVPRGAQLKHRFKMKNLYSVPMQITNIRSSCGCLTFKPSTELLQPKEEGYIDINMDARRFTGPKMITLHVTFGPQYVSTAVFTVTANARADVVFNPGQVDFGVISQGQPVTQTIDVEYAGDMDWRIVEVVKNADAPFTVSARETYRVPGEKGLIRRTIGKVGYQIAVTLKADAAPGPFRQELLLKTNDPNSPVLTVAVEGNVQAALRVDPGVVNLGPVPRNNVKTMRVVVSGTRPFRIVGIEGAGSAITADLPAAKTTSHVLTLRCRPDQAGEWHKQLTIRTDLDEGATATIAVDANVQP
jgi:hypothetical protein